MTEQKQPGQSKAVATGDPSAMDAAQVTEFWSAVIDDGLRGALTVEECKALESAAGRAPGNLVGAL